VAQLRAARSGSIAAAGLVLGGAGLFGTVGTAQILGPDLPPAQLAAARLLLAAVLLATVAVVGGHSRRVGACARAAPTWWAGLAQATFNLCFLGAIREAGVAMGTLIAIGATPVLTGLVTRRVSPRWLVATGIAVAGLVLLVTGQAASSGAEVVHPTVLGIALALGASASYAAYIIAGNAAAARGLETPPYLAVTFGFSALLTVPLLLLGNAAPLVRPGALLLVGYLALVPTVMAYSLFNRGLKGVRSSTASTLGLLEPVVAAVLAIVVVGERLSVLGLVGAVLILVGLVLVVRSAAAVPGERRVENAVRG
jgi:drug/metabolite transporter, DME family